jgi:hypothetical protein
VVLVVAALAALRLRQGQEQEPGHTSNEVGNPEASTR